MSSDTTEIVLRTQENRQTQSSDATSVTERIIRESQESKITSTPQRGTREAPSPSFSSIHDLESNVSSTGETLQEQFPEETEDTEIKQINRRGKFWKIYKPISKETLYGMVLSNAADAEEIVVDLLSKYKESPRFVIETILKFIIDVSGYQHLDIAKVYDFDEPDAKETIHRFRYELVDELLMKAGSTFLLLETQGENVEIAKEIIYRFIHKLILAAHNMGILYDDLFGVRIFDFLKCMAFSVLRNLRFTGIVFCLKFLTNCGIVYEKIAQNIRDISWNPLQQNSEQIVRLKQQRHMIHKYLQFFYLIFAENCLIPDKKGSCVRADCAKEIENWITYIPEFVLLEKNCLKYLVKLIVDESNKVRLNALLTMKKVISASAYHEGIKSQIQQVLPTIAGRMKDVDFTVAAEACGIFTQLLTIHPTFVQADIFKKILVLMYKENITLASAAAEFITLYIRLDNKGDSRKLLSHFARISGIPILKKSLGVLVEVLLPCAPEIQNWDDFLVLLLEENVPLETRVLLLELMRETLQQILSTSACTRKQSKQNDVSKLLNCSSSDITSKIIPHISNLLKIYKDKDECLISIFKIVTILDYSCAKSNFNIYYTDIISLSQTAISNSNDGKVIEAGAEAIFTFYDKVTDFKRRAIAMAKEFCKNLVEHYHDLLNEEKQDVVSLYSVTLRISKLFKFFDITEFIDWEDIFDWNLEISEVAENLIVSSKFYLIWAMKNLIEDNEAIRGASRELQIQALSTKCKDFIKTCFDLMQKDLSESMAFVVYESVCDLHLSYYMHLKGPVQFNQSLKTLMFKLEDEYSSLLFKFLDKYVIENNKLTPKQRQQPLADIIDLIFADVVTSTFFSKIFNIYAKHYNDFRRLFDSLLEKLCKVEDALFLVIIYTLVDSYSELLKRRQVVDFNSEEFKSLCLLAKKLSSLKMLKVENLRAITSFYLDYFIKDKKHYQSLYLLKYFVQNLPMPDKSDVLIIFRDIVPEEDKKDSAVLAFAQILKGEAQKEAKSTTQLKQEPKKVMDVKKKTAEEKGKAKKIANVSKGKKGLDASAGKKSLNITINKKRKLQVPSSSETTVPTSMSVHDESSDDIDISEGTS